MVGKEILYAWKPQNLGELCDMVYDAKYIVKQYGHQPWEVFLGKRSMSLVRETLPDKSKCLSLYFFHGNVLP